MPGRSTLNDKTYIIARFLAGLGILASFGLLILIAWELGTGVSHHRVPRFMSWDNGMNARENDPTGFWFDIGVQALGAVYFVGFATYARRIGRDDRAKPVV